MKHINVLISNNRSIHWSNDCFGSFSGDRRLEIYSDGARPAVPLRVHSFVHLGDSAHHTQGPVSLRLKEAHRHPLFEHCQEEDAHDDGPGGRVVTHIK